MLLQPEPEITLAPGKDPACTIFKLGSQYESSVPALSLQSPKWATIIATLGLNSMRNKKEQFADRIDRLGNTNTVLLKKNKAIAMETDEFKHEMNAANSSLMDAIHLSSVIWNAPDAEAGLFPVSAPTTARDDIVMHVLTTHGPSTLKVDGPGARREAAQEMRRGAANTAQIIDQGKYTMTLEMRVSTP
ncbi:predicted protein [Histoplasma mississippiense (nom. inval.)]|uniref:predicted protein n=1 Tax=Ajellomyces capsulatus (strain NAm1 / WU24) TaxID=2059318 RepID=UPI000157C4FA|nr:predicted protein [Histoplasma mississippiense (nom. inval.)]EDN08520.1 predicted protein [Histoplasma mississippiense (nom. inval.)]